MSSAAPDPTISPVPTEEEAAAIVAAIQVSMSAPAGGGPARPPVSRWRFSGRWWSRPVPLRRARPSA
ncbi:MAG TPA: hypothetical protein VKZ55_03720 [Microthrixaceae bacterium]|nr:hypothetical protein [Microthrixaceae bacterium]